MITLQQRFMHPPRITDWTGITDRAKITSRLRDLALLSVAAWWAAGHILQGTALADYSASLSLPFLRDFPWNKASAVELVLFSFAICISYWPTLKQNKWKAVVFFYIAATLMSCALAALSFTTPSDNRFLAGDLLGATATGLLAARICGSSTRALLLLCALMGGEAALAISHRFMGIDRFYSGHILRASGSYDGPFSLYKVLVPCIPITLAFSLTSTTAFKRGLWGFLAAVIGSALLATWYRCPILAASLAVIFLLLKLRVDKRLLLLACVLSCVLVFATFHLRAADPAGQRSAQRSLQSRPYLWKEGMHAFVLHPLFGVGKTNVSLPAPGRFGDVQKMNSPFNQLIFALVEGGSLGGLALLVFSAALYRGLRRTQSPLAYALSASWLSIAICGITDTMYGVGSTAYAPISCVVGLLIGATLMMPTNDQASASKEISSC